MKITRTTSAVVVAGLLAATACGGDDSTGAGNDAKQDETTSTAPASPLIDPGDGGSYAPELDAANFVDTVDNPYMPLAPGMTWSYRGEEDGEVEIIEVAVTDDRKEIQGIAAVVVHDRVSTADGTTIEDTYDWFAQDKDGNVWYLGEDSTEYEDGKPVSKKGSWEAGVDGAYAGIVMQADPREGQAYRQEFYKGEAEDLAEILQLAAGPVDVKAGSYDDLIVIREWNPLEPDVVEEKTYAPGVGVVLEEKVQGGDGRVELTATTSG